MCKVLILFLCLAPSLGWAKNKTPHTYQDAVLVSFRYVSVGTTCSHSSDTKGNIDADTDGHYSGGHISAQTDGTVKAHTEGSSSCQDEMWEYYTLSVGEHTYVIHPDQRMFGRKSVLADVLPGTHVGIRNDRKHFYVSVDGKESKFMLIEAK